MGQEVQIHLADSIYFDTDEDMSDSSSNHNEQDVEDMD